MRNISVVSALASAASLLIYTQASSSSSTGVSRIKGGVYFQRDFSSPSLCAFSSWRHPSQTTLFHDDAHKSPAAAAAKVFLPSTVYRKKKQSAVVVKSTSIEPGPNKNQDTTTSKQPQPSNDRLVIIIGGSGFLGTEIRHQLQERGIKFLATTTPATFNKMNKDEKENFVSLDLTSQDAQDNFYNIISSVIAEANHNNNDDDDNEATSSSTAAKEIAVIAAMGSIGTKDDEKVNSAIVEAIKGAHRINLNNKKDGSDDSDDDNNDIVKTFVTIGNTQRVRRLTRKVSFLNGYAAGKDETEKTLQDLFGSKGCVIKPSFIYGGEEISLTPPRVPQNLGNIASEVLGLYPFQALADELPDVLALPLAPPISVEMVASAAINVALGIVEGYTEELEGKEAIVMAGSVRGWKEKSRYEDLLRQEYLKSIEEDRIGGEADDDALYTSGKDSCSMDALTEMSDERRWARINELKDALLRRNGNENINDENDMEMMEELECLRPKSMIPADDPKLNGRWNFVLSKDDLGTQLIKELLPPDYHSIGSVDDNGKLSSSSSTSSQSPPWKALLSTAYQLQSLYMLISENQSRVEIVLSSKLFFGQIPFEIVFCTSLLATNYDEETAGLLFLEKFEDVELRFGKKSGSSWKLPLPNTWQRFRHLEITFLDEEIVIARGSGGDPHILVRAK